MANRFPLVINNTSTLVGELLEGDSINLQLSGIFDGSSNGSSGQVLSSTGSAGVLWVRAADVFVDDSQTLINKSFLSSNFDGSTNTFLNIPNSALSNPSIVVNGNSVSLGGVVNTPNDNDNTTYGISIQDGFSTEQKALRLTAGGTGTGFQDNFIQYDTDPNNILTITRIGTDTLEFSALVQNLTLDTHLSFDSGTVYDGSVAKEIRTDATPSNDIGTIVSRDVSGGFSAGQITANLTGNVTGNVSGSAGSVEQSLTLSTYLSYTSGTSYNGSIAREIQTNATALNTANTIAARNGSGEIFASNFRGTADEVANTLTRGSYLTGNNYNGSAATTWAVNASTSSTANTIAARDSDGDIFANNFRGTADKVSNLLTRGTYLTGNNYDGSAATTWAVDASATNIASKVVVRNSSGNFSANRITANSFVGNGIVPVGGIIMWSGAISQIPSSWALCNGANGTPDLRNRFVAGAFSDSANSAWPNVPPNAFGGSANAIVVTHNHALNSNQNLNITDPGHTHRLRGWNIADNTERTRGNIIDDDRRSNSELELDQSDSAGATGSSTSISISGSTQNEGSSGSNANLPPWYALAYIMRIS
jgi:hypothetical protein